MKRMWLLVWLPTLLFPSLAAAQANDLLYLQGGEERVGELIDMTGDELRFKVQGEKDIRIFSRAEIQRVDLSHARAGDDIGAIEDLDDPLIKRLWNVDANRYVYPDSGYLTLYCLMEKRLHQDGSFTQRERRVEKVLLERGKDRANVARYFKKGEETLEIDFARTINANGVITPITDATVDITSVNADTPEYEKLYQVKFAMKQVRENSILDYQLTKRRSQTDLLNPFASMLYFRGEEPILEAELRVIVPRGVELAFQAQRDQNLEFTTEETRDEVIYRFRAVNCPRVVPEPYMPPPGDCYPRVLAAAGTTWEEIGTAFRNAVIQADRPSAALQTKVRELVGDVNDPEARARRVYEYFTKEIRQVWVGPDAYSFAPRPVDQVFESHAGNITDKAALLRAMLVAAGLSADIVLCCPQQNGKLVEEVPCIAQLDDALVSVDLPFGPTLLSLDNDAARFGQMPYEYQGTRGLLVSANAAKLITIPLNEPDDERYTVDYSMKISPAGDLTVTKIEAMTGNQEIGYRAAWKDEKEEEIRRQLELALTDLHAKARLDHYTVENLHDLTRPFTCSQTYTLEEYAMRAGDILLAFRIPELEYSAGAVGRPTREFDMRWPMRTKNVVDVNLEIPPAFKVYYAGKDYQSNVGPAGFAATFEVADHVIHYHDEYVQNQVEAPAAAYHDFKACLETMARVSKEWIVLEKAVD